MRAWLLLLLAVLLPLPAHAGELAVSLRTPDGKPATDAVVMYRPNGGVPPGAGKFSGPLRTIQTDIHFDPFILVVPVGAEVTFPNKDKVRHHVYSFSPAKRFELKLYGRDESRSVVFDKAGIVALGCNIHDQMIGFVVVVDTPYTVKVGADGEAVLTNLPPGGGTLTVWQPFLRTPNNQMVQTVAIPAQGTAKATLSLSLRAPPADKTPLL